MMNFTPILMPVKPIPGISNSSISTSLGANISSDNDDTKMTTTTATLPYSGPQLVAIINNVDNQSYIHHVDNGAFSINMTTSATAVPVATTATVTAANQHQFIDFPISLAANTRLANNQEFHVNNNHVLQFELLNAMMKDNPAVNSEKMLAVPLQHFGQVLQFATYTQHHQPTEDAALLMQVKTEAGTATPAAVTEKKKTLKSKSKKLLNGGPSGLKPGQVPMARALDGTVLYCCPQCNLAYPDKEMLEQHLVAHKIERRFICNICGAGLKRKEHLERHKSGHNPDRPYVCNICTKGFKRKEHLNLHTVIHSGQKTEICSECGKGFYRKDHLQKHQKSHLTKRIKDQLQKQQRINQQQQQRTTRNNNMNINSSVTSSEGVKTEINGGEESVVVHCDLMIDEENSCLSSCFHNSLNHQQDDMQMVIDTNNHHHDQS